MPDETANPPCPTPDVALRLGTMGCSFDGWLGTFYPKGLGRNRWLAFYATQFNAIELNTTFYATPSSDRIERWVDQTPDDFRFAVKAGKQITHDAPLADGVSAWVDFLRGMRPFGKKLGPVLLQLGPHVSASQLTGLDRLLREVPKDWRAVVEFRCDTWLRTETWDVLRRNNAAAVGLDHIEHANWGRLDHTTDVVYARLVGKHGRYETETHELWDPTPQLKEWQRRLHEAIRVSHSETDARPLLSPPVREAWVMFNNNFAGHAPTTLRRFAALENISLPEPPPRQKTLF